MNKSLIGFLQALGVAVYCALVSGLFWLFSKFLITPQGFIGTVLMLILLVFSVAVVGSIVFGYSAYLALNGKIKEALILFGYTILYCLGIILILLIILSVLR